MGVAELGAETRAPRAPTSVRFVRVHWLELLVCAALVVFSFWVRVDAVARDVAFARAPAEGLFKSDPGLLYYLTERVASAEGLIPSDWRADPRIAYPELVDIPADYTVGQEFLFGWSWRAFGGGRPLWLWCHYGSAWLASLAVLGVWGLARELSGRRSWAFAAAFLYVCLPASYRTLGFLLIREDASLPLFALHVWLAARAARRGTRSAIVWATVAGVLAMATWHAMTLVLAIEAWVLLALYFLRGRNALEPHGGPVLAILFAAWWGVPALRGGPVLAVALPLCILYFASRWRASHRRLWSWLLLFVSLALWNLLTGGADSNFGHVREVLLAKLRHGGVLPADPSELSFDARLLWQGPFATMEWGQALAILGVALVLGLPASVYAVQSRRDVAFVVGVSGWISLGATWFVLRLSVLPAVLLPPLVAFACAGLYARLQAARARRELAGSDPRNFASLAVRVLPALVVVVGFGQALAFQDWCTSHRLSWYRPESRNLEIARMIEAVRDLVPEGEAVAGDFMNSTAILAQTGHPIVLQPKWERAPARRRVESFWNAFYQGSPQELHDLLKSEYDCRYLVVDRFTLWTLDASRYLAGLGERSSRPPAGSAAAALLDASGDSSDAPIPGYRLLWSRPPPENPSAPPNFFLYRLE